MKILVKKPFILFALIVTLLCWAPGRIRAAEEKGPLQVRNQFPPHLLFLTPVPQSPRMPADGQFSGSLAVDYSSVFFYEKSATWNALIDMETAVIEMTLNYGITDRLAIGLRLPLVSMNAGFLDGPLATYHRSLGLPNYDKQLRPENDFAYELRKDGRNWLDPQSGGLNLGDITIEAKLAVVRSTGQNPSAVSLSYQVKLPTGDSTRGFGSGAVDHGFFVPIEWRMEPWIVYLTPGYIRVADPKTGGPHVAARDIKSLFVGGEYLLTPAFSLLAQINAYTSPLEKTGIDKLDDGSLELAAGFQWQMAPQFKFEFAFCEDLSRAAPDFNLHGRIVYHFF